MYLCASRPCTTIQTIRQLYQSSSSHQHSCSWNRFGTCLCYIPPHKLRTINRTVYNTSTGVCMVLGIHLHTSTPQFHQNHCLSHTQIHVHETCLVQACLTLYKIPPPTHVQFNATCTVCRHIHACTTKHHSVLCPTCSLVLITSIGVLPKTLAAPASPPLRKVFTGPMSFALSPCWKCFFKVLYTKKRMAWLVPCFSMVGTSPW